MPKSVFKIFRPAEWEYLSDNKVFDGSVDDKRDGFIHLSTADQVAGTLAKYYTDGQDIILAQISTNLIAEHLKYETSRGGQDFPHLYKPLKMSAISQHWRLPARNDGSYAVSHILETHSA